MIKKQHIEASKELSYSYEQIINDRITKCFTENPIRLIDIEPINIQNYYNVLFSEGLSGNTVIHYHALILRHSCASLLLAKGIPMKAIQE